MKKVQFGDIKRKATFWVGEQAFIKTAGHVGRNQHNAVFTNCKNEEENGTKIRFVLDASVWIDENAKGEDK